MADPYEVINYEIQMFLGLRKMNETHLPPLNNNSIQKGILNNAMVESRILHIRILAELFLDGGQDDDIKIKRLLPFWPEEYESKYMELKDAYTLPLDNGDSPKSTIDKLLAHATRKRGPEFNWGPVIDRMLPPLMKCIGTLPFEEIPALRLEYIEKLCAPAEPQISDFPIRPVCKYFTEGPIPPDELMDMDLFDFYNSDGLFGDILDVHFMLFSICEHGAPKWWKGSVAEFELAFHEDYYGEMTKDITRDSETAWSGLRAEVKAGRLQRPDQDSTHEELYELLNKGIRHVLQVRAVELVMQMWVEAARV